MQVSVIGRNCTVPFGVRRSEDAESRQVGQSGLRITFDAQQGGPGFVQPQRVTRECFREEMTMPCYIGHLFQRAEMAFLVGPESLLWSSGLLRAQGS